MYQFRSRFYRFVFLVLLCAASLAVHAEEPALEKEPWLSITPYVGFRHIGLDVVRHSDGYTGNIGTEIVDSLFFAIGLETFEYSFKGTPWGFTLYGYAANVDLTEQWVADGTVNANGTDGGNRVNVGTKVSGYYSYLVPTLHFNMQDAKGNGFKAALGYGVWHAKFSGDIILTPNDSPVAGLPTTSVDVNERKWAYLFLMQFHFQSGWTWYMSVGGPRWEVDGYTYEMEEAAMALGYTISFYGF